MPVAIDIGGSTIRLGWVGNNRPTGVVTLPTPGSIDQVPGLLVEALHGFDCSDGIGIGCAGVVDRTSGIWRWMPHAVGSDVALGPLLEDEFGVKVVVDNDANMAVLAEATAGAGASHRSVLMVLLGTGIGAGLTIDRTIERGSGTLGEVGHMRLADEPACACGAVGCWETQVSGRVMDALARSLVGPGAGAAELLAAATSGHEGCRRAVSELGRWLGIGLGNLILAMAPDAVVIGGGAGSDAVVFAARRYLESANGALRAVGIPPIRPAAFGSLAGLVGAGLAVEEMAR